ncbi:hypothetical protein BC937DRAFT_93090 [Endogone sp. FLAS-F59071]|nr:hypothetical protein BC937DRAFT_93090 [Endogone sp. FLAS-F59071]|eukprot:RUS21308.1 hypothetical protein BC937DRAFT_93090 [Endogone sp. FLAS-F59071]
MEDNSYDIPHVEDSPTHVPADADEALGNQPEGQFYDDISMTHADTPTQEHISTELTITDAEQGNPSEDKSPQPEPQKDLTSREPSTEPSASLTPTPSASSTPTPSVSQIHTPTPPVFVPVPQISVKPPQPAAPEPASWQIPPGALQKKAGFPGSPAAPLLKLPDKTEKLEARIAQDVFDVDAWVSLLAEVQAKEDLDKIRDTYERFLKQFPTSSRHWLNYLELELKLANFTEVETLFTRCLKTVLSVDLWKFYLNYIRRINSGENGVAPGPESRAVVEKAYEYVLNNVGLDKDAGAVWGDYLFFLKTGEAHNTYEEQRKMDNMRRVYQRAIAIPLNNVEHLWKEYDQWENALNRLTGVDLEFAKKFLAERSPAYMTARTALREMRIFTDAMIRGGIPKPPQWTEREVHQLDLWKRYILWEKSNPLHLDDTNVLADRIMYAYQQALLVLRFYPEIWYVRFRELLCGNQQTGKVYVDSEDGDGSATGKVRVFINPALFLMISYGGHIHRLHLQHPCSFLVHFAYAELCESRKHLAEARAAFESLLAQLTARIEQINRESDAEVQTMLQHAAEERAAESLGDDIDGEMREQIRMKERERERERGKLEEKRKREIEHVAKGCSLVWISYMRFSRRAEGIKTARTIFSKARKSPNCTYHVFIASALMEYYNSKDPTVAGKIFELGLKMFGDDPSYVCQYLEFLIQLNDDNNTRALFERTLATMPADKAKPVWQKFSEYENKYGDLTGIQKVEKRRSEAYPEDSMLERFADRYSYLDIHQIVDEELGGNARKLAASDTTAPSTTSVDPAAFAASQKERPGPAPNGSAASRRPLLEAVHPEKYPRPDFNQWVPYKPSASTVLQQPIPQPIAANTPTGPGQGAGTPKMDEALISTQRGQQAFLWKSGPHGSLPEAVGSFLSSLPPAHGFNERRYSPKLALFYTDHIINANDLIDLIRSVHLPVPAGVPPAQVIPPGPTPAQMQPQPIRSTPPPPGAGPPVRGSKMDRGGMKRKSGREFEDEEFQAQRGRQSSICSARGNRSGIEMTRIKRMFVALCGI